MEATAYTLSVSVYRDDEGQEFIEELILIDPESFEQISRVVPNNQVELTEDEGFETAVEVFNGGSELQVINAGKTATETDEGFVFEVQLA